MIIMKEFRLLLYFEIFVFLKVKCIILGENKNSEEINLKDTKRKLFERGAIDSFILLLDK